MKKAVSWLAIFLSTFTPGLVPAAYGGFGGVDLILPTVGRVDGNGGSHFYTTIWVTNPSPTEPATFQMAFLRQGQSNESPLTVEDSIAPGATKTYENAAETLFNVKGAVGALRLRSSQSLLVSSRIYNQDDGQTIAGSQGLFSSGIPSNFGVGLGDDTGVLQGVRQNADFRYNLFLVETGGDTINVELAVLDAHANVLGTRNVALRPWEPMQLNVATIFNGTIDDGAVRVTPTSGAGRALVLGSQVANDS
ncbi:MAG TPA: hypothetical protein VF608_11065, partial [Thermoanaerobaculia bacterium]